MERQRSSVLSDTARKSAAARAPTQGVVGVIGRDFKQTVGFA